MSAILHIPEKRHNIINEFILLVKVLAMYSATSVKNFATISSGPVNVSDQRSSSPCKTLWKVTSLREKQSDPVATRNVSSDCSISTKLNKSSPYPALQYQLMSE